ncbi:hypothetical protein MTR67_014000 [Solanum verrucosum]|uniref:Uncharacterized protein n=1 Tax=Solanum verrucosum TaxID=315347 RepID=A0AAF0QE54_SOLVR|nr:hypothetical protein MTR67_014000 [Solanum verrucosum]
MPLRFIWFTWINPSAEKISQFSMCANGLCSWEAIKIQSHFQLSISCEHFLVNLSVFFIFARTHVGCRVSTDAFSSPLRMLCLRYSPVIFTTRRQQTIQLPKNYNRNVVVRFCRFS